MHFSWCNFLPDNVTEGENSETEWTFIKITIVLKCIMSIDNIYFERNVQPERKKFKEPWLLKEKKVLAVAGDTKLEYKRSAPVRELQCPWMHKEGNSLKAATKHCTSIWAWHFYVWVLLLLQKIENLILSQNEKKTEYFILNTQKNVSFLGKKDLMCIYSSVTFISFYIISWTQPFQSSLGIMLKYFKQ